jgi:cold shock CspA family protein
MATGKIGTYDPEKKEGYIIPDTPDGEDDQVPFESEALEKYNVESLSEGEEVRYKIHGGMTGLRAVEIRPI